MFKIYTGHNLPSESEFSDGDDFSAPQPYEPYQEDQQPIWDCNFPCDYEHDTELVGALSYTNEIDDDMDYELTSNSDMSIISQEPQSPSYEQYLQACELGCFRDSVGDVDITDNVPNPEEGNSVESEDRKDISRKRRLQKPDDLSIVINVDGGRKKRSLTASSRAIYKAFRDSDSYIKMTRLGIKPELHKIQKFAVNRTDDVRLLLITLDDILCIIGIGSNGVDILDFPVNINDMSTYDVHGVIMNYPSPPEDPKVHGEKIISSLLAGVQQLQVGPHDSIANREKLKS